MLRKTVLSTKFAVAALLILTGFFGNLKYKQLQYQRTIEQQKQEFLEQASALQEKNNSLHESLSFLSSPNFKERIARQQLNMKKEGEVVFTFSEGAPEELLAQNIPKSSTNSNPHKWWNYFFNN